MIVFARRSAALVRSVGPQVTRALDESGVRADRLAAIGLTNQRETTIVLERATGRAIVICALDNLGKGAAGQAVQNANHALGLAGTAGLRLHGVLV